ncbi:uncharacterized protein LOC105173685 isoform X5 [Sesamum indicum]|uniref:Uncharacterized protein LOC105173685 isoform X5 n=1 Tax=Sesamum indicum TaxID=4182 RepID=A0A8M8VB83_SESIN|nr:uncharacterized protein LOC105173685 isoform X5 [Sesamum indicum]
MTGLKGNGSPPSLPLPRPKSPPEYADLYRKRREMAKVQMLEREIGFLEACRVRDVQCRSSYTCQNQEDSQIMLPLEMALRSILFQRFLNLLLLLPVSS